FYLVLLLCCFFFFFFQAEDGIRDGHVTGVQTCALPISGVFFAPAQPPERRRSRDLLASDQSTKSRRSQGDPARLPQRFSKRLCRSEERRVGKECRSRWSPYD